MRVAVLDDYQQVAARLAEWDRLGGVVQFFSDHVREDDALVRRLEGFDVVVAMRERTPFPAGRLRRLPDLRLLVTTGRRNASIDAAAARELGITVCGTDSPGHATAELTFALIQILARGLAAEIDAVRAGSWQVGLGRDLRGATLGVIGLGRLGRQVAGFGRAFGMEVIAWSENLTEDVAAAVGVRAVTKDVLLDSSDFATVHLRLSDRTRGLVGESEISQMQSSSYLINTSRGPIVDVNALVAAVREGRLAGAALDVFDEEPLPPDSPLRAEPRIIVTPHIGYVTRETYAVFFPQVIEAIEAWRAGSPIRVIDP